MDLAGNPLHILVVDDSEAERLIIGHALRRVAPTLNVHSANDGAAALTWLRSVVLGQVAECPHVDMLLLDLQMPVMGGIETLQQIRQDERLHQLPVVMLTASEHDSDIERSYQCGANAYLVKPVTFDKFLELAKQMAEFWFDGRAARLGGRVPRREGHGGD